MMRARFELACRTLALVLLGVSLWASWRTAHAGPTAPSRYVVRLPSAGAEEATRGNATRDGHGDDHSEDHSEDHSDSATLAVLRSTLMSRAVQQRVRDTMVLPLTAVPAAAVRAALGSMVSARVPVRWQDSTGARGLALSVTRDASPGAPLQLRASTGADVSVVVRDAGGLLDSLRTSRRVNSWRLASASNPLRVRVGASEAAVYAPDSTRSKRLLVFAQPGWEGKFVVAALEEGGWQVDGIMRVSPTGAVTIGAPQRLDPARYAAALVLDSMPVDAAALSQFVRRGGGLVLGGDALRIPSLAAIRSARAGEVRGAVAGALLTDAPRVGLDAWELDPAADAVVLATDRSGHGHDEPALVARRVGAGRVVAMPYRESWRWRMQGTDDGLAAHRAWWMNAVAASLPGAIDSLSVPVRDADSDERPGAAAPYADLVAYVGAAEPTGAHIAEQTATRGGAGGGSNASPVVRLLDALTLQPTLLLLLALGALLAEWTSRRLRGVR